MAGDPAVSTDEAFDRALAARIRAVPVEPSAASAASILAEGRRRARARAWRSRAAGVTALAAAAAAVIGVRALAPDGGVRARGRGPIGVGAIGIEALAEGSAGLRPVASGATLGGDEAVVVRVDTAGPGQLTVWADGARLWPADGAAAVDAGQHWLGDPPLAWTPDGDRAGAHTIVAELCPADPAAAAPCARAAFAVRWGP